MFNIFQLVISDLLILPVSFNSTKGATLIITIIQG